MKKKKHFGQRASIRFSFILCKINGPNNFCDKQKTNNTKVLKFAMIYSEYWEHVWYKFQTFMLNMTEVTVKCFVKSVALSLKLSFLFNFYYSGIKFGIHLLPYVEIYFWKHEWYSLFSFDFIAKTEGPVYIETTCIYI